MGASDVMGRLALAGVRLSVIGPDKLAAEPREALTDDLRTLIREHKSELLAALVPVERGRELRRQRVMAMLRDDPSKRRAAIFDTEADPGKVICTLAIREVGTCELFIPAEQFDPVGGTPGPRANPMKEFPRKAIPVIVEKDEHASARNFARMVTSPEVAACRVVNKAECKSGIGEEIDVPALLEQLREEAAAVNRGDLSQVEAMLTNQATALQTLFARLSEKGLAAEYLQQYEAYMRMALRAQSQCTRTLEVLATIRTLPSSSPGRRT